MTSRRQGVHDIIARGSGGHDGDDRRRAALHSCDPNVSLGFSRKQKRLGALAAVVSLTLIVIVPVLVTPAQFGMVKLVYRNRTELTHAPRDSSRKRMQTRLYGELAEPTKTDSTRQRRLVRDAVSRSGAPATATQSDVSQRNEPQPETEAYA